LPEFFQELNTFCNLRSTQERYHYIKTHLQDNNINFIEIKTNNARHFMLNFVNAYDHIHRAKILVAHYDRVHNTPGANDNSASIISLLNFAKYLKNLHSQHNIYIIFTDKEEITKESSPTDQGSYELGKKLRKTQLSNALLIVFDMTGIGDTFILNTSSKTIIQKQVQYKKDYHFLNQINFFNYHIKNIFKKSNTKYFEVDTLFSDDLGFMFAKIPAIQLSLLPYKEAKFYYKTQKFPYNYKNKETIIPKFPYSWKKMHTQYDTVKTLNKNSFKIIENILKNLTNYQIPN